MAKFNGYVLTEKGRELLAKGLGGGKIEFTKMQIGDGTTTTDARNMTALVNPKKDLTILNINVTGGQCELTALLSNQNLNTGFYIKELGVFARGTDGIEILYAYNVSINPDFIPPFNANNIVEIEYVDTLIVDQAANVTAVIDPSITYITKETADKTYLEKIKWFETIGGQFGGYVSKVQNKEAGKLYINDVYDNKLYVCVTAHSSTSFDAIKYRDITNNGLSDQLRNLYEVNTVNINIANGFIKFIKKGTLVHAFLFVESAGYNIRFSDDTLISNYPTNFIPNSNYLNTEYAVISEEVNNRVGNTRLVLRNNGITIFGTSNNSYKAIKGTAVYSV